MSPRARDADHSRELNAAARDLTDIAKRSQTAAQLAADYGKELDPLLAELDRQIGGTATGTDRQIAGTIRLAQQDLKEAQAALVDSARRANQAAAAALSDARKSQTSGSGSGRSR